MVTQYILFYISVGILASVIFNFVVMLIFKAKGAVFGYKFKVGSPHYKRLSKRASPVALAINVLAVVLLAVLVGVEAWAVQRRHVPDSLGTLVIGSAILLFGGCATLYVLLSTFPKKASKDAARYSNKRNEDDSWLR